jgi:uncharacterized protein YeaO (DUF488 family)
MSPRYEELMAAKVQVKRVHDDATDEDGQRVLVDRVWPRGLSKASADLSEWCKDVAPSTTLRTWYSHDPDRWEEFRERYRKELQSGEAKEALAHLKALAGHGRLTLLTASRRDDISQATVLAELLNGR